MKVKLREIFDISKVFRRGMDSAWSVLRPGLPLLLLNMGVAACAPGGGGSQPFPGTGLSLQGDRLVWELTVGVLNSRDFPRINRVGAQRFLKEVEQDLKRQLPGLEVRFILDQPLDAPFMMERLIRKKARLDARYRDDSPVLLLDGGASSRGANIRKARAAGLKPGSAKALLAGLEELQKVSLPGSGKPLVTDRMASSDLVWREFLRQQVRYDLILTNAFIYPDDLRSKPRFKDARGGVRMRISRAEGRTGMEGMAALISLYSDESAGRAAGQARDLNAALLALILPGPARSFTSETGAPPAPGAGPNQLPGCADCPSFWKQRRMYLRGIAHINRANFKDGCPLLRSGLPGRVPSLLRLGAERRDLARRNHQLLLRKCPGS